MTVDLCQCEGAYPKALRAGDEVALGDCRKCGRSRILEVFRTRLTHEVLWSETKPAKPGQ